MGDCPCGMVPTLPHPGERRQEGKRLYPGFLRTLFFQMPGQPCARHMLCRKGQLQKARLSKSCNSQTLRAGRPIRAQVPHGNRRRSGWQRRGGVGGAPPLQTWLQPLGPAVCRSVSGCARLQAGDSIEAKIRPLEA